jgi:hypothetical protein
LLKVRQVKQLKMKHLEIGTVACLSLPTRFLVAIITTQNTNEEQHLFFTKHASIFTCRQLNQQQKSSLFYSINKLAFSRILCLNVKNLNSTSHDFLRSQYLNIVAISQYAQWAGGLESGRQKVQNFETRNDLGSPIWERRFGTLI